MADKAGCSHPLLAIQKNRRFFFRHIAAAQQRRQNRPDVGESSSPANPEDLYVFKSSILAAAFSLIAAPAFAHGSGLAHLHISDAVIDAVAITALVIGGGLGVLAMYRRGRR